MFGLFNKKKSGGSNVSTSQFLMKADEAYVRAFQTKVLGNLDKYLTRLCCTKLMERIRFSEKENVGIERYKKTTWTKSSDGTFVKQVTFDDVNMGCGVKVPLGDSYMEYWTVINENNEKKVSEIRRQTLC